MCGASSQTSVVQTLQHSKKHFLTLVPELLQGRPGRSPQVANLSVRLVRVGGQQMRPRVPSALAKRPPARAAPGAGPEAEGPSPGAGRGPAGLGAGPAGGRGGVLPSLALSGKVSRCCRAQPRLLLLLPRPGGGDCAPTSARAAPCPPASMATTATCTRFTDDYQLFEELGKYGPPASRGSSPP